MVQDQSDDNCPIFYDDYDVTPNIIIALTGEVLVRYKQGDKFVRIGIPDFGDAHRLTINLFEMNGPGLAVRQFWRYSGPLTKDLWLEVTNPVGDPAICFHVNDDHRVGNLQDNMDVRWVSDFERSDYHNRELPCDESPIKHSIFLQAGHFYTAAKSDGLAKTIGGILQDDLVQVAVVIGANITLEDGEHNDLVGFAKLKWDDGSEPLPRFIFSPMKQYQIVIDNNPMRPPAESTLGDFKQYYRLIKGVSPGERIDLQKPGGHSADDVPCNPAGSGSFPPSGGGLK